jgi:hypothetical protein
VILQQADIFKLTAGELRLAIAVQAEVRGPEWLLSVLRPLNKTLPQINHHEARMIASHWCIHPPRPGVTHDTEPGEMPV